VARALRSIDDEHEHDDDDDNDDNKDSLATNGGKEESSSTTNCVGGSNKFCYSLASLHVSECLTGDLLASGKNSDGSSGSELGNLLSGGEQTIMALAIRLVKVQLVQL